MSALASVVLGGASIFYVLAVARNLGLGLRIALFALGVALVIAILLVAADVLPNGVAAAVVIALAALAGVARYQTSRVLGMSPFAFGILIAGEVTAVVFLMSALFGD